MATEASRYQIHDGTFGLALYEAPTAQEALVDFLVDRSRAEIRHKVEAADADSATVTLDGVTYTARRHSTAAT